MADECEHGGRRGEGGELAEVRGGGEQLHHDRAWKLGWRLSYGPPWAHCLGGYQFRLLGGPLGLPGLRYTALEGVEHKDYIGVVLG
jgi:hypothetical protein